MSAQSNIFDWKDFPEYADYPGIEADLSDLDLSEVDLEDLACVFCTLQITHPNRKCKQVRQYPRTYLLVLLMLGVILASGIR